MAEEVEEACGRAASTTPIGSRTGTAATREGGVTYRNPSSRLRSTRRKSPEVPEPARPSFARGTADQDQARC